ncbi:hypothetical protein QUB80_32945 [Chlorogloeopsis sp. ULAP01]|uniref:hypothetical protein n=1 Tax=Chlorogloeopsis sp. ULAP01 TaxID=3056483 RepID=UPI0025AA743B|nr:hypothetical protein [Chlorogloeopsis sp. ULAP01]MDM9385464.1 hypothetical protein [Chlorogloeopsis sp. ULAP01]
MNTNTNPNIADGAEKNFTVAEQITDWALDQPKPEPQEINLLDPKFNEVWLGLTSGFENLLLDLRKKRHDVDTDLKKQIEVAVQRCRNDTGVPAIKEIQKRYEIEQSYEIIYEKYLNEIRAHITRYLSSLDEVLQRSPQRVKSQVAEVLIAQDNLGKLTEARGSEFIKAIAAQIPNQLVQGKPSQLKSAFQVLAEFELSYPEFLHYRIRPHLDGLTPNEPKTLQLTSPSAEQVFLNLKIAQIESVRKCEKSLKELLSEPNQLTFVIVEDFVDCVIRAADIKSEWQLFLQQVRTPLS